MSIYIRCYGIENRKLSMVFTMSYLNWAHTGGEFDEWTFSICSINISNICLYSILFIFFLEHTKHDVGCCANYTWNVRIGVYQCFINFNQTIWLFVSGLFVFIRCVIFSKLDFLTFMLELLRCSARKVKPLNICIVFINIFSTLIIYENVFSTATSNWFTWH